MYLVGTRTVISITKLRGTNAAEKKSVRGHPSRIPLHSAMNIGGGAGGGERGGDGLHNRAMEQPQYTPPSLEIVEEPVDEYRFRYLIEGRTNGSISGVNSTPACRTYPTLRVLNYTGPVKLQVSCVTKDPPFRPHPHKLVGRAEMCDQGVATIYTTITAENSTVQFRNLGIQCVKRNEVAESLELRQLMRVDPFRAGFDSNTYSSIGLHFVRLAFQLFVPDAAGRCVIPHRAVASRPIFDAKAKLRIVHVSACSGSVLGGTQITILTEKLPKDDVSVVFEEQATGWQAMGNVVLWHKGCGLVVTTPPYCDPEVNRPVDVVYYLKRMSNANDSIADSRSNSFPFEYIPVPKPRTRATRVLQLDLGTKRPRFAENSAQPTLTDTENILPAHISSPLFQEIPPIEDQLQCAAFFKNLHDQNQALFSQWDPLSEALQWYNNSDIMGPSPFRGTDSQVQGQPDPPELQQACNYFNQSSTSKLQFHPNSIAHTRSNQLTADTQHPSTSKQTQTSIGNSSRPPMEHLTVLNHRRMGHTTVTSNTPTIQTRSEQTSVAFLDHVAQISHNFPNHPMEYSLLHPNVSHASPIGNATSPMNQVSSTNHGSPVNYASSINHASPMNYGSPMNYASPMDQASPMNHGSPMNHVSPTNYASPMSQAQLRAEAVKLSDLLRNAQSVDLPPSSEILESLISLEPYESVLDDLSDSIDQLSTNDPQL